MKTKDLVAKLQEADPSGELHCCVSNGDIWDITVEPAYWDGRLHVIEFDENNHPIRGCRVSKGSKVVITPIHISEALEWSNFQVVYQTEEDRKHYEAFDIEARRRDMQVEMDVERDHFVNWVFIKIQTIRKVPIGWIDRIKEKALKFYDEHSIGPDNPFTQIQNGRSYNDCREEYYEDTFSVDWDNFSRILIDVKPKQEKPNGTETGS